MHESEQEIGQSSKCKCDRHYSQQKKSLYISWDFWSKISRIKEEDLCYYETVEFIANNVIIVQSTPKESVHF